MVCGLLSHYLGWSLDGVRTPEEPTWDATSESASMASLLQRRRSSQIRWLVNATLMNSRKSLNPISGTGLLNMTA
jgi:hypothetical protein